MLDIEKYTFLERESIEESNYEPSFGQKNYHYVENHQKP